jgi:hypothetical protein
MKYLKVFENFDVVSFEQEIEDLFYDFSVELGIDKLIIKHRSLTDGEVLEVKFYLREEDEREPVELYNSIKPKLKSTNDLIGDVWGFKSSGAVSSVTHLTPGYRRVLNLKYYK